MTNDNHFYVGVNNSGPAADIEQVTNPAHEYKNGGFEEVKMINNHIGYIKWNDFMGDDGGFQKAVVALQFIQGCKFLIFDLSDCPGGDGRIGAFVNRHLFEGNDYQDLLRKKCSGETAWHASEVPYNYSNGPKLYNIPVFVIVSKRTASAAEYFALIIKEMKRGIVLGDTTGGAGNPSVVVTFGNYFAQIPVCEIQTKDGQSIEGKGVTPNVKLQTDNWLDETVKYIEENYH
jgi:C-terminal processing protease CtpA/Prc